MFFKGFPFLFFPFPSWWHQYPKPCPCHLPHFLSFCFLVGLCGVVYSTTNVQHGLLLVFFLGLSPLSNFVALVWHENPWHPLWLCCFHFFFFARCFKWRYLTCKCAFKIRGCVGGFWYLLSMFYHEAFFFVLLFPFLSQFLKLIFLFIWPSWEFLKDFWV